jgi:hypothetical protein
MKLAQRTLAWCRYGGSDWCGCSRRQNPKGDKMNNLNEKET